MQVCEYTRLWLCRWEAGGYKAYGFVVFVVMDLAGALLFSHQFTELRFRRSRGFIRVF